MQTLLLMHVIFKKAKDEFAITRVFLLDSLQVVLPNLIANLSVTANLKISFFKSSPLNFHVYARPQLCHKIDQRSLEFLEKQDLVLKFNKYT